MKLPSKPSCLQLAACALATVSLSLTSCQTAGEGALSGAALGAATGAIIGNQSGDAGKGALLGGAVGAAGGALIGNENNKKNRTNYRGYPQQPQYRGPSTVPSRNYSY